MPDNLPLAANVRGQTFYVALTAARCWHCGVPTRLLALAMPENHETLDAETQTGAEDGGEPGPPAWQRTNMHALLFDVQELPGDIQKRLSEILPPFRLAHSPATLNSYWANHCEHCGSLLGDQELHCEPEGAFMPASEAAAANIQLVLIEAPFEAAAAGYACEPEFFAFMRRS